MTIKRIVDVGFWNDEKVVELFSPEDKLFFLYLLTNPHSRLLGIYSISKKTMGFELGYSLDTINVLLDRFENKYKIIKYSKETGEIAIKNYLKYGIVSGGKPVEDCLIRDIQETKNKKLISFVFKNIRNYNNINKTIYKVINEYDNDNGYGYGVSYDLSYNDTSNVSYDVSSTEKKLPNWFDKDFKKDERNLDELDNILSDFK